MVNNIPKNILNDIISSIPTKRLGKPNEICDIIDLLLDKDYITGENININGGLYMR